MKHEFSLEGKIKRWETGQGRHARQREPKQHRGRELQSWCESRWSDPILDRELGYSGQWEMNWRGGLRPTCGTMKVSKSYIEAFTLFSDTTKDLSMRGPQNRIFLLKIVYSYMFKHQSPLLSIGCNTPIEMFSHCSKSFLSHQFWCLLVFLDIFFASPLPHQQNVSLLGLFSSKETKESVLGQKQVNREGGAQGSYHFRQKLVNTQRSVGRCRCAHKSPIRKRANALRVIQKNPTCATAWMELETTMLSEISQAVKDKYPMISQTK